MSTQAAKLFSAILAGACAVLLLLALAMQFGFGRGYSWLRPDADSANVADVAIDKTPFKLPPQTQFADTTVRPLFNDDRKPTPDTPDTPDVPPPPKVPLNIALTGIILTPQLHLAMVHDKLKNADLALKEGMPMDGDQGGWTLTKINPRSAVFRETSGEEVEVELSTAVAGPIPAANVRAGTQTRVAPHPPAGQFVPGQPVAAPAPQNEQAQALQRRIEERRAQMREEAERLRQQKSEHKQ
jgi:general secretion pathway protein N